MSAKPIEVATKDAPPPEPGLEIPPDAKARLDMLSKNRRVSEEENGDGIAESDSARGENR